MEEEEEEEEEGWKQGAGRTQKTKGSLFPLCVEGRGGGGGGGNGCTV